MSLICCGKWRKYIDARSNAIFLETDVSSWPSILSLFEKSFEKFKSIDVVYANAGTNAWDTLLEDELDKETGKLVGPKFKNVEINLFGVINTVKAAVHFFGKHPQKKCQIVLTGSAAR